MEQKKAKRGRPRIDTHITENGAPSRRQAVNAMYMFEGVHLITVAATEIPDSNLLWFSDDKTMTVRGKNGILEQIGRMLVQDRLSEDDCIYVANLAIAALKNGKTSREIEYAIREIRTTTKRKIRFPECQWTVDAANDAVLDLYDMGGTFAQDF